MNGATPIEDLYKAYLDDSLSEEELNEFLSRLHNTEDEASVDILMQQTWADMFEQQPARIVPMKRKSFFRVAAAAVLILVMGAAAYLVLSKPGQKNSSPVAQGQEQRFKNDVQPGTNKPQLVLADGRTVILDSAALGLLATEGNVKVVRDKEGNIVYGGSGSQMTDHRSLLYNTITNPRGSKVVPLTLVDGTKVWLDAGSSITFPNAFVSNERKVQITGQAYFEVVHNASKPFHVQNGRVDVTVLGTHFNVNAFDDEDAVRVTLLQGSVKVSNSEGTAIIKPGEQATLTSNLKPQTSNNVDLESTMAWKNGIFKFQDIGIESLMKQLARWYDVEVVYQDKPSDRFVSTIPRDVPASQVFKILETTGRVHFKIEGKKVTVMK